MRMDYYQIDKALDLLEKAQPNFEAVPKVNRYKVEQFFMDRIEDPKTFIGVNKDVTAILILEVGHDYFSTAQSIRDIVFYSETTGSGFRLLKEAKQWVEAWGDSVHAAYFGTSLSNGATDKMLERTGLVKIGTQFKFKLGDS